jgi:uncharacterized membrane protein
MGRSARPSKFFDDQEAAAIVTAIGEAERATSGEIRVHLEHRCKGGDPYARGAKVFEELGMTQTAARNGVLIYLATKDHCFAVLGDEGIDEAVPEGFWSDVVGDMETAFRAGDFARGMTEGIRRIGEKLAEFFPYAGDDADENELPDELSLGED